MSETNISVDDICEELRSSMRSQSESDNAKRVFVLMGPNGSGKTRLLNTLAEKFAASSTPNVFISAQRTITDRVFMDKDEFAHHLPLLDVFEHDLNYPGPVNAPRKGQVFRVDLAGSLSARVSAIWHSDIKRREEHKRNLLQWDTNGQNGAAPVFAGCQFTRYTADIEQLCGLQISIGERVLGDGSEHPAVFAEFRGFKCLLDKLSDGQKQILMIIDFFLQQGELSPFVAFVDEPELHLEEARTCEFWSFFERKFRKSVFVYSSHSVQFSTRDAVNSLYTTHFDDNISRVDLQQPVSSSIIRSMVGARVQLLRSEKLPIYCEDEFSCRVIDFLMADCNTRTINCFGKDTVLASARKNSITTIIRSNATAECGVIDRDARSQEQIAKIENSNTVCFPFNETESLMAHPDIIYFYVSKLAGSSQTVEMDFIRGLIVECADHIKRHVIEYTANFIKYQSRTAILFDINRNQVDNVQVTSPFDIQVYFEIRANEVLSFLDNNDIEGILQSYNGKELYAQLRQLLLKRAQIDMQKSAESQFNLLREMDGFRVVFMSLPGILDLRRKILRRLQLD